MTESAEEGKGISRTTILAIFDLGLALFALGTGFWQYREMKVQSAFMKDQLQIVERAYISCELDQDTASDFEIFYSPFKPNRYDSIVVRRMSLVKFSNNGSTPGRPLYFEAILVPGLDLSFDFRDSVLKYGSLVKNIPQYRSGSDLREYLKNNKFSKTIPQGATFGLRIHNTDIFENGRMSNVIFYYLHAYLVYEDVFGNFHDTYIIRREGVKMKMNENDVSQKLSEAQTYDMHTFTDSEVPLVKDYIGIE